ncbi:hypothetical protein ACFL59_03460 [Planctomycetota bacterium]
MGWGTYRRRDWPEYKPRPKAAKLSPEARAQILKRLLKERDKSPVLTALQVEVKARRGRFYVDRMDDEDPDDSPLQLGRITPLAGRRITLLLEIEYRSWKEIARGGIAKVMKAIAGDTEGRFHGLGALDAVLRKRGLDRVRLAKRGRAFRYADGESASVQEILYHRFGVPISVIAEPSGWYEVHRHPAIVEHNGRRNRVLVEFSAFNWRRGERFGGRCLYARRTGEWAAYTIKPSESNSIAAAEAWLEKRSWNDWC